MCLLLVPIRIRSHFFFFFPPLTKKQQHTHRERTHWRKDSNYPLLFIGEKVASFSIFGPVCFLFDFFFPWLPIEYNKKEPGFFFLSFFFLFLSDLLCVIYFIYAARVCVSLLRAVSPAKANDVLSVIRWIVVGRKKKEEYKDTTTLLAPPLAVDSLRHNLIRLYWRVYAN